MRRLRSRPAAAIAVDWSGARQGAKRIWVAEVAGDELVFLRGDWTPEKLVAWLKERADRDPATVIGLDFAFSFPAWFVRERLGGSVESAWSAAGRNAERWLDAREAPFWGRPGRPRPAFGGARGEYRRTEEALSSSGRGRPKSIFQVGGAGSVGTGSVRGMAVLAALREDGFAIWPFDRAAMPLVVEIYPRALTGRVVKADQAQRRAYLERLGWPRDRELRERAAAGEDAFDAAVSARVMAAHLREFATLAEADPSERLEGRIWIPRSPEPQFQEPCSFEIRAARPRDVPAIRAIYAFHVEHGLGSFELEPPAPAEMRSRFRSLRRAGYPFLVAEVGGTILGYAYAGPYRPRPAYRFTAEDSVYVSPDAQGRGAGTALLRELLARLRERGTRQVVAVIGDSGNRPSIALHRKLGFRRAGVLRASGWKHERWVDTVLMQLDLDPAGPATPS